MSGIVRNEALTLKVLEYLYRWLKHINSKVLYLSELKDILINSRSIMRFLSTAIGVSQVQ